MRSRSCSPSCVSSSWWIALALVLPSLAACAENRPTFFVREVKVPEGDDCLLEPGNPYISSGVLDVAFRNSYVAPLSLVNQTFDRSEMMPLYLDNGGINVEGAEVELHQDAPEGALIDVGGGQTAFTTYAVGYVPSTEPGDISEAVVPFDILPLSLGVQLAENLATAEVPFIRILAGVRVFGRGLHGYEVETPQFFFPIDVCFGCLVAFPADANDPENPAGICDSTDAPDGSACFLGQDRPLDCRYCVNSHPTICGP